MIIAILFIALGVLVLIGYAFSLTKTPHLDLPVVAVSPTLHRRPLDPVQPPPTSEAEGVDRPKEPSSGGIVRPLAERAIGLGALGATVALRVASELRQTEPSTTRLPLDTFLRPVAPAPAAEGRAEGSFLDPLDDESPPATPSPVAPVPPPENAATLPPLPRDPRSAPPPSALQQIEFTFEEDLTEEEVAAHGIYDQTIEATVTDLAASRERLRSSGVPPPRSVETNEPTEEETLALFLPPAWNAPPPGTSFGIPNLPLPDWLQGLGFTAAPVSPEAFEGRIRALYAQGDEDGILAIAAAYRAEPHARNTIFLLFPEQIDVQLAVPILLAVLAFAEAPIQTSFALSLLASSTTLFDAAIVAAISEHWEAPAFAMQAVKALVDARGLTVASELLQQAHLAPDAYEPYVYAAIHYQSFAEEPTPSTGTLG